MITGNKTTSHSAWPRLRLVWAAEHQRLWGFQSTPSSHRRPNPGERVPCLGSAKPIACDATVGSDLDTVAGSGTMDRREDGTVQPRLRRRVSLTDRW